jgi:spermidine synthase
VGTIAPLLATDSPIRMPLMVVISFLTLLLPTIGMGATLPFLARYLVRSQASLAARIGVLYGLNTLGAAVGSLVVGFALIGLLGLIRSSLVAMGIYTTIGLLALLLARDEQPASPRLRSVDERSGDRGARDVLTWVFAFSGFVAIGYEIVWFRMLVNTGFHKVFAFSGMLSAYLVGLVTGSLVCARFLAPHKSRHLNYFAVTQLLISAGVLLSLAMLGRSRFILNELYAASSWLGISTALRDVLGGVPEFTVLCFLVLLLPTTLIGISFPLASELTIQRLEHLGRRLGMLYALNTLGGVLGSLTVGFVLLPWLGSQGAITILIGLNLVLFGVVYWTQPELRTDRVLLRKGIVAVAVVGVSLVVMGPHYLSQQLTNFIGAQVLEFRETKEATYVVLEYDEVGGPFQQLIVNNKSYANNRPSGRRYMAALAHYPVLLHDDPQDALVVCIGTGTTVGALTTHRRLESIDAVDVSRHVFDFAPYFEPLNQGFHNNPRVRQFVADGRHFLLSRPAKYDVVTFEPPPPHDAGVVNLYSEEFYGLVKQRMRQGSIIAQWVPMDMPRGDLPLMILRALTEQFAHVSLWMPNHMQGIAIASMEPLRIDPQALGRRMAEPTVSRDLAEIGIDTPEDLLATLIAADDALTAFLGDVSSVTDDRPKLEYHNFYPTRTITVEELDRLREPVDAYLTQPVNDPAALQRARRVISDILFSHEAYFADDLSTARQYLRRAIAAKPNNTYLKFLNRRLSEAESGPDTDL